MLYVRLEHTPEAISMQMDQFQNGNYDSIFIKEAYVEYKQRQYEMPCVFFDGKISPFREISMQQLLTKADMLLVVSQTLSVHDFHQQYKWPFEEMGVGADLLRPEAFMAQSLILNQEGRAFIALFL